MPTVIWLTKAVWYLFVYVCDNNQMGKVVGDNGLNEITVNNLSIAAKVFRVPLDHNMKLYLLPNHSILSKEDT